MNRHDLRAVKAVTSGPAVTITLPTHRTSPDNQQDPIRLRNLVREASDRLTADGGARPVQGVLDQLQRVTDGIDFEHLLDGLAVYASEGFGRAFTLPFSVEERVVIGDTFVTRDLVYALNRARRYWVLVLSEKPTRLFEGTGETVTEMTGEGFPLTNEGPGGATAIPGGFGRNPSAHRDERHRQFFRAVDDALAPYVTDDPGPLFVAGVDRYLSFFDELSRHRALIAGIAPGNYDTAAPHEIATLAQPLMDAYLERHAEDALADLAIAVGGRRSASTLGEVWRFASEGRVKTLLAEEDYHEAATVDDSGRHLSPAGDAAAAGHVADAVDDTVEAVLSMGGDVVFVPNGSLGEHGRIAAILRY